MYACMCARTQVRGVRLRKDMVVVALEQRVLAYAFADLRLLLQARAPSIHRMLPCMVVASFPWMGMGMHALTHQNVHI